MRVGFQNRQQIEQAENGSWIAQALNSIIAAISASWDVQHRDDGSHGTITLASATGPSIDTCTGTPEGVVIAPIGSIRVNLNGGAATTLYVKTAGSGSTGWTAK